MLFHHRLVGAPNGGPAILGGGGDALVDQCVGTGCIGERNGVEIAEVKADAIADQIVHLGNALVLRITQLELVLKVYGIGLAVGLGSHALDHCGGAFHVRNVYGNTPCIVGVTQVGVVEALLGACRFT